MPQRCIPDSMMFIKASLDFLLHLGFDYTDVCIVLSGVYSSIQFVAILSSIFFLSFYL